MEQHKNEYRNTMFAKENTHICALEMMVIFLSLPRPYKIWCSPWKSSFSLTHFVDQIKTLHVFHSWRTPSAAGVITDQSWEAISKSSPSPSCCLNGLGKLFLSLIAVHWGHIQVWHCTKVSFPFGVWRHWAAPGVRVSSFRARHD